MTTTPFPLPIALTPADRKALRARAHHLDPVVMIGDAGLSRAVLAEADRALGAHELIKIRVLGEDRAQRQALLTEICSALGCAAVQSIGKLLVVYRPKPIEDSGRRASPRAPHVPKKRVGAGTTARRAAPKARKPMKAMKVAKAAPATAPARAAGTAKKTPRGATAAKEVPRGAAAQKAPRGAAGKPEPRGTTGKRTALGASARIPARHGASSAATQGPGHLAGRSAPATRSGRRDRARKS
jgi:putative YhbY family RNA-binding protein